MESGSRHAPSHVRDDTHGASTTVYVTVTPRASSETRIFRSGWLVAIAQLVWLSACSP